ncbi:MAG: hypothetical protein MK160_15390 [Rhodobacteraceae bacterium]|nr:hypothetical protein [Paracoccaceae bacterium]
MRFVISLAVGLACASQVAAVDTDPEVSAKVVYQGALSCGVRFQCAGPGRFHFVERSPGFRRNGQFVYRRDDTLRKRGSFSDRDWGWALTHGAWRVDLDRVDQRTSVHFRRTLLARGRSVLDPAPAETGSSVAIIDAVP